MSFKLSRKYKLLLLIICLGAINANCWAGAQIKSDRSEKSTSEAALDKPSNLPKLPARGSPLGRRRGGTSRNNCPALNSPLTAFVPGSKIVKDLAQSDSYLAFTIAENPTFWVYLPQLPPQARIGEFILQTETGEDLRRAQIELPATEGVIGVTLALNEQNLLAIGNKYHWYFKIYCETPSLDSDYFFVDAWIERIPISIELKNQLQTSQQSDYLIYRDRHVWYDALTTLAQEFKANPGDIKLQADWANLLESIHLSQLQNLPIIKIYQL